MAKAETLCKVRTDLRIKTRNLDGDLRDYVDACLADLIMCGIRHPNESDPLILNAIKLFCRAAYTDDSAEADRYKDRYDSLKGSLMMATGYGGDPA